MGTKRKLPPDYVRGIANGIVDELSHHCDRIEIVGSLRRGKAKVSDIDILCIPKKETMGMFNDKEINCQKFVDIVCKHPKSKGDPVAGKYFQRFHYDTGIHLEFYTATKDNWGLMQVIRTGPSTFSRYVMVKLKQCGYQSCNGYVRLSGDDVDEANRIETPEEKDVFDLCGMEYVDPRYRM